MSDFDISHFLNVSRETLLKLIRYHDLLLKWQKKINLISPNTIPQAWDRHFVDSIQVFEKIDQPQSKTLIDMGSGAGFPGLVLAVLGVGHVTLIESDRRKCIFLKEVVRQLALDNVTVLNKRIEKVGDIHADIITARALASLEKLIKWATPFLKEGTQLLFLKGQAYRQEMDLCHFGAEVEISIYESLTDSQAKIISLSGLSLK